MPTPALPSRPQHTPAAATPFETLTLTQVQSGLSDLYRRIAARQGRVEIIADGDCDCVLISKAELDSLERALNILGDTVAVRELSSHLAHLAECVEPEHAGV